MNKRHINQNQSGDINRNKSGDINRNAGGDINRNADEDANFDNGSIVEEPTVAGELETIVEVEGDTLKDKLLTKTNRFGVTQDGRLTKTFFWGFGLGIGAVILVIYLKKKGYIKMSFLPK